MSILQRLSNESLVEKDIKRVGEYVKNDFFERAIFLWDQKALDLNGVLHTDFLANCKSLVGGNGMVVASNEDKASYMNCLWNKMTERECYKKWMQTKRSNTYQVLQDRFMSKCICCFNECRGTLLSQRLLLVYEINRIMRGMCIARQDTSFDRDV